MGCSGSKATEKTVIQAQAVPVEIVRSGVAPPAGQSKGQSKGQNKGQGKGQSKGKGKGKGAGKGTGKGRGQAISFKDKKFQVDLSSKWEDYGPEEDTILKRAMLVGQPNLKFHLRGQNYEYNFKKHVQKNLGTGKERKIRAPPNMTPPKAPLLPPGPMIVMIVPAGGAKFTEINDPANAGKKIQVALPPYAKAGTRIAVPVPSKGEDISQVVKRQQEWSTGAKVATGAAAVGALAVGGVVLGEHLSGGAISGWAEASPELDAAGEWAAGAAEDIADAAGDVADTVAPIAEDVGDWAVGAAEVAGDWVGGAVEVAGDWAEGAAGDIGEWTGGAVDAAGDWAEGAVDTVSPLIEDAGDWLGDTADIGADFLMDLF